MATLSDPLVPDQDDDLVDLFGDVLRRTLLFAGRDEPVAEGPYDRISRFVVRNSHEEGLSPRDAASCLGCSVSSVQKYCAAVGTTFGKMIMSAPLSRPAYRLSRENWCVAEIAFDCGFASVLNRPGTAGGHFS